ncbi:hypothetical protein VNI00_007356 [Paramarasmius palmivorus]|uniref:Uncharacterized protein n=1 Tax=Paramarasmius palmivorus TaxID=297713 RepID=A0AAW0D292_9AGAR
MHAGSVGFEQPQATPVVPHIIENYTEWPSNLSAFTEPLFRSTQNPTTGSGSRSADLYPLAFNEAMSIHERLLRVLSDDALHPELGPDPKTTIIGPLAGRVLQHVFPHAEL